MCVRKFSCFSLVTIKAEHTTVEEVRVGSTTKAVDTVGNYEFAVNDVVEWFG